MGRMKPAKKNYKDSALKRTIDECIEKGILQDFLTKERARVMSNFLYEYDEEAHMKLIYEEGVEDATAKYEAKLAEKDIALAEKDSALEEKDALIASLQEKLKAAGL